MSVVIQTCVFPFDEKFFSLFFILEKTPDRRLLKVGNVGDPLPATQSAVPSEIEAERNLLLEHANHFTVAERAKTRFALHQIPFRNVMFGRLLRCCRRL